MIVAVIDLGTNTFNLLITEIFNDGTLSPIFQTKIPVMLGKESISSNVLSDAAMKRGMDALTNFKEHLTKHKATIIIAKGTSALREAKNANEFIQKAKKETGIEITVISGEKEAEYIYCGVCGAIRLTEKNSLMMDIGGGSTEFIIANEKGIVWKHSFLLGAARLLEKFCPSDPITSEEITAIENYLRNELSELWLAGEKNTIDELIGVAGVFESLADIIAHNKYFPELIKSKTEYMFNISDFHDTYKHIIGSTRSERLHLKGLIEMRVDMIVVSVVFINLILREFNLSDMRMSAHSLKEGVLRELIKGKL